MEMHRRSIAAFVLCGLMCCSLALVAGCGRSVEEDTLANYFRASRLRDNTTLANIATVAFRPDQEGIVESFDITSPGEEQRRTLRLRELAKEYETAQQADEDFTRKKQEYQDANIEAIGRVLKAEQTRAPVARRDVEVQAAWAKWRQETAEVSKRVEDARTALDAERGIAEVSVYDSRNPVDVTTCTGELLTRVVTLNARVRPSQGPVVEKALVAILERAVLKTPGGQVLDGRWIVTAVTETGAAGTS